MTIALGLICLLQASLGELKQSALRYIQMDFYPPANELAESLNVYQDPEGIYLSIALLVGDKRYDEALSKFEAQIALLKPTEYYAKSLEILALGMFKKHFASPQEPVRLTSLMAISLESDVRVLNLLLEALDYPSLRVKLLVLDALGSFPDERVKKLLLNEFKNSTHPEVSMQIAALFGSWKDTRILKELYKKIADDSATLHEKIHYVAVFKELEENLPLEKLKELAYSTHAGERLLAAYFISKQNAQEVHLPMLVHLLKDPLLWVKESALLALIKLKIKEPQIEALIESWEHSPCFDLQKGYFFWGLVTERKTAQEAFLSRFQEARSEEKKALASILYASGPLQESLINKVLTMTSDPCIQLQLGLYQLGGEQVQEALKGLKGALDKLGSAKLSINEDPIYPFFEIEEDKEVSQPLPIGLQRYVDKSLRVKIFHLLATKKMGEAKEVLKMLLKSDLLDISLEAMVHFWEDFGYEDKEYFEALLKEADSEIRFRSALVLNYLVDSEEAKQILMQSFVKQSYPMKIQILFSLSKHNDQEVHGFFLKQMRSKYPTIQAVAAGCLFKCLYN